MNLILYNNYFLTMNSVCLEIFSLYESLEKLGEFISSSLKKMPLKK